MRRVLVIAGVMLAGLLVGAPAAMAGETSIFKPEFELRAHAATR